ncbi:pentatricopeptide repeat-containing protein At2g34400-like [Selaginella moellendorffii]|uniref:pentatricopeptide repeat-containing protein At2g34400-like n=1 Tax=Selaginella moellendorffii TaxID=88036 RepID=UPI000D1C9AF7|nr:pentatricopeptide repeat-containing protein At2g34400-like [Selaginella moellendorffii]XP_024516355.1 pentatricopeptide repeat-containing protein At2g34400-like [Selaginella moellendorffii]XP_024516357.1 pentatricopeptide repeat-containing protein At2g34400-like [Selaginella moellendorffii]|eukprot:XP_024516354.1 pentatricopeptide repeat-containing protein At2g34400-like [Selaginella moellendorffii]
MKGVAIHSHAAEMGFEKDVYVASSLVDMYAKCGCLSEAGAVFDRINRPNAVSWNSLLMGCVENGENELALQLFREMRQRRNCAPDDRAFVSALMACTGIAAKEQGKVVDGKLVKLGSLKTGMVIHCQASKSNLDSHGYVVSTLVDTYSSCGSMLDARQIFDRMPQHDLVAWNALIRGYAENGEPELAVELYRGMENQGCAPDGRTFLAALTACGSLAALEAGRRIHDDVRRHRAESDTFVANALIDFYGKCGSPVEAQGVFDSMEGSTRNLVTWSALISGYSRQGDSRRVFDLFQAMQQQRIQPDGITLASVLTACSHAGLADQGKLLLETMVPRFGIAPDVGHYNCVVDMLGRANRLDEAVKVATTMPFEANAVTWKTVLGACHKWNNVEVARLAFQSLERLEGRADASSLVLFGNIVGCETPR